MSHCAIRQRGAKIDMSGLIHGAPEFLLAKRTLQARKR